MANHRYTLDNKQARPPPLTTIFQVKTMPAYYLFKKGNHINAVETNDIKGAELLESWEYIKQNKKITAPDKHIALERYIKESNDEIKHKTKIAKSIKVIAIIITITYFIKYLYYLNTI